MTIIEKMREKREQRNKRRTTQTRQVQSAYQAREQAEAGDGMNLEETAREAQGIIRGRRADAIVQNVGLAAFLFGIVGAALTVAMARGDGQATYLVMFFVMCAGVWLAAYRFRYMAVIIGGLQILIYTIYQLYRAVDAGVGFAAADYAWLLLPEFCIVAMILFMSGVYKVEKMADVLEDKIRSMEVIEPVTGLPNLRSLYLDLERQMAYSRRNDTELTLMIFELRYYQELKAIMSGGQLSELKRRMSALVEETLRLEDKVYAIDDRGSLALVCVGCGRDGAIVVKNRVAAVLGEKDSFEGILDRRLRVDVRMGYYVYDREKIGNAIEFKQKAENELQYDV